MYKYSYQKLYSTILTIFPLQELWLVNIKLSFSSEKKENMADMNNWTKTQKSNLL